MGIHGLPLYDKLERVISPTIACQSNSCSQQEALGIIISESSEEHKLRHFADLGKLGGFMRALQDDACNTDVTNHEGRDCTRARSCDINGCRRNHHYLLHATVRVDLKDEKEVEPKARDRRCCKCADLLLPEASTSREEE